MASSHNHGCIAMTPERLKDGELSVFAALSVFMLLGLGLRV